MLKTVHGKMLPAVQQLKSVTLIGGGTDFIVGPASALGVVKGNIVLGAVAERNRGEKNFSTTGPETIVVAGEPVAPAPQPVLDEVFIVPGEAGIPAHQEESATTVPRSTRRFVYLEGLGHYSSVASDVFWREISGILIEES